MGTAFCNAVVCNDEDFVRVPDCRKTVGDGDGCPSLCQLVQTLLYKAFAVVVQRTGGFIQNEDWRIFQKDAGNGNPLLLSAGEARAAFPGKCIVTVRHSSSVASGFP